MSYTLKRFGWALLIAQIAYSFAWQLTAPVVSLDALRTIARPLENALFENQGDDIRIGTGDGRLNEA
jgi:hypothetical protein